MGCDLIGSTAAEVGVDVFDGLRAGLGPIGWAWVGGELLIEGLLTFDTVQEKLSSVMGSIVQTSIDAFTKWVDMKALAEYFLGDKTKGATGRRHHWRGLIKQHGRPSQLHWQCTANRPAKSCLRRANCSARTYCPSRRRPLDTQSIRYL